MRLLLDTHIWLWSLQDRERLGKGVLREIANTDNEIWLSPVSIWEVLTLQAKGRVRLGRDLAVWVADATAPFREAPLTHQIAFAARQLPLDRKDPADRFLAATARVVGLTLVTADVTLLGLGDIATLANR